MIDSKNSINSLSKALLDSVRGVMEGKKLDPVGKETKDIDNDGDVDKSDKYLHNRRKAIGAAMKKEEVEEVQEVLDTPQAIAAYKNKAKSSFNQAKRDGKQAPFGNMKADRTVNNRTSGIQRANRKYAAQHTTIAELTKATLGSYIQKAGEDRADHKTAERHAAGALKDMSFTSKARDNMVDTFKNASRKADNRRDGINRAINKLTKEDLESYDYVIDDEEFGVGEILDVCEGFVQVMFEHGIEQIDNDDVIVEEIEDIQELSIEKMSQYRRAAKNDPAFAKKKGKPSKATLAVRAKRTAGMEKADQKISDAYAKKSAEEEKIHHENVQHVRKHIGSVLEKNGYTKQTTHEKRDTYTKPNHETGHVIIATVHHAGSQPSTGHEPTVMTMRNSSGWQSSDDRHSVERHKRDANGRRSYGGNGSSLHDKKSALQAVHDHIHKYEKDMNSRDSMYYEDFARDEGDSLTEAKRGRPRKNPLPAGKEGGDEEGEANLHIINQLRKAQISMTGQHKVTFHDGSSHHVSGTHAAKILDKYAGMKPSEKEEYQKKVGASHKALMSEV